MKRDHLKSPYFHIAVFFSQFYYGLPQKGRLCFMRILAEFATYSISRNKGKKKKKEVVESFLVVEDEVPQDEGDEVQLSSCPCSVSKQSPCDFFFFFFFAKSLPCGSLCTYLSGLAEFAVLFRICLCVWVTRNCRNPEERCLEFLFTVTSLLIASLLTLHT